MVFNKFLLAHLKPILSFFALSLTVLSCSSSKNTNEPITIKVNSGSQPAAADSEGYYVIIEEMPKIIGGFQNLQDKVRYPKEAKKRNIEGIVRLGFMVKKDGEVGEIRILQSPHPSLSRAAKKAIRKTAFTPGKKNGNPADVYMTLPIIFKL